MTAALAALLMVPSVSAASDEVDISLTVTTIDIDSAQVWLKVSLRWPSMPTTGSSLAFVPYRCLDAAEIERVGNDSRSVLTGQASNGSGTLVQIMGPASSSTGPGVVHLPRCIATLAPSGAPGEAAFVALDTPPSQVATATVMALSIQGVGVRYASPGGTNVSADRIEISPAQRGNSPQTRVYLSSGLEAGGLPLILVGLFIIGITGAYSWFQRSEAAFSKTKMVVAIIMFLGILAIMVLGWYPFQFLRNFGVVSVAAAGAGHGLAMIIVQISKLLESRNSLQTEYPVRGVGAEVRKRRRAGKKVPEVESTDQSDETQQPTLDNPRE